ncbi:MAG: hypothetical protein R3C17_00215 [Planctomycetaceae bacterium]
MPHRSSHRLDTTPEGSAVPIISPAGYYAPEGSAIPIIAPAGTYAPAGSAAPTPAPAGTYIPHDGAGSLADAVESPAGYYAPTGSTAPIESPAGYYAPVGSAAPILAPAGYYAPARSAAPIVSPGGYYAPAGSGMPIESPAGYYAPAGSAAPVISPAGYYAPPRSAAPILNPSGTWSLAGAATPTPLVVNTLNIIYGTLLQNSQLSGNIPVPGTYSYTSGPGRLLGIGNGQIESVTFTPADPNLFAPVVGSVFINVAGTGVNRPPQLSLTDGVAGVPTFTSGTPVSLVAKYTINEYAKVTVGSNPQNGDVLFTLNAHDDGQSSSSLLYALTGAGVTNPSIGIFIDRTGGLQFDAATGRITVFDATKLDYEKFKAGISLVFTVTDNGLPGSLTGGTPRPLTSRATVTILLNDLNDAPRFATSTLRVSRAENNVANAAVVALRATDGDLYDGITQPLTYTLVSVVNGDGTDVTSLFAITPITNPATGVVTQMVTVIPAKLYDFESTANKTFTLTARATEVGVGGLASADSVIGDQVITLNITDVNEAPQLSLTDGVAGLPTFRSGTPVALVSKYTMNEYTTVTAGSTPRNGEVLFTLNAHDDDQSSSSLLYALTGAGVTNPGTGIYVDRTGALQFDAATGRITVLDATKLDYEKFRTGIPLVFTVTDNGLPGSLPDATQRVLTSRTIVTILLNDLNDAPTFATSTLTVSKAENNPANAALFTVRATDGDTYDGITQPLRYSLVSVVNGDGTDVTNLFTITPITNPTTGVITQAITVIPARLFDFESTANRTFTLTVRATEDGVGGLTSADSVLGDQVIMLRITDVNEAPSAVFTPSTHASGLPTSGATGSVTVNLPDLAVGTVIGSLAIVDPDILAALGTFGPDSVVVTVLDSSSATAPALNYTANADPTTGGSLSVNSLTTLQSRIGKPFTVRFAVKDRNGIAGALAFTLNLTINLTNTPGNNRLGDLVAQAAESETLMGRRTRFGQTSLRR